MPTLGDIASFTLGNLNIFGPPPLCTADLSGKTIIVTGSNTGLGYEAALHLARMNPEHLILACRNVDKGETARQKILSDTRLSISTTSTRVSVWELDMDSPVSMRRFCSRVQAELPRLDGLLLNAGIELIKLDKTVLGLERTLAINVVGTMYLATTLLPLLRATARDFKQDTTLSIVGSCVHCFGPVEQLEGPYADGRNILDALSDDENADMAQRYTLSKLMVHLAFGAFAAEEQDKDTISDSTESPPSEMDGKVIMNIVNPGWCSTELARSRATGLAERCAFTIFGRTGEQGGRTLVHALVAAERESHRAYLSECKIKSQSTFVRSDEGGEIAQRLWDETRARFGEIDRSVV